MRDLGVGERRGHSWYVGFTPRPQVVENRLVRGERISAQ